jgi:hypothetical protein
MSWAMSLAGPKREKPEISDYQGKRGEKSWLGSKDSNLDCMIQIHKSSGDGNLSWHWLDGIDLLAAYGGRTL